MAKYQSVPSTSQSSPKVKFSELKMHELLVPTTDEDEEDGAYIRTASKGFVDILKKLKCQQRECDEILSHENLPVIIYCGHYVCSKCYYKDGAHLKDRALPNPKFVCPFCSISHETVNKMKLRLSDPTLNGFLAAVNEEGYICMVCKGLHPQNNSVRLCLRDASAYLCVWCAATNKEYVDRVVENVDPSKHKGDASKIESLSSVDYSEHMNVGCAYAQCCTCMLELDHTDTLDGLSSMIHLPCGHTCHEKCFTDNEEIICNMCGKKEVKPPTATDLILPYTIVDVKTGKLSVPIPSPLSSTVGPLKRSEGNKCSECKRLHPLENLTGLKNRVIGHRAVCVWCFVVKNQERLNGP